MTRPGTVAHRVKTVIDYGDRLIVQVAEFDTPLNLMRKKDSIFRNACVKVGRLVHWRQRRKPRAVERNGQ